MVNFACEMHVIDEIKATVKFGYLLPMIMITNNCIDKDFSV